MPLGWVFSSGEVVSGQGDIALSPRAPDVRNDDSDRPGHADHPRNAGTLLTAVYSDLCDLAVELMRHERPGHALHPTGLVHEAALRLLKPDALPVLRDRRWFYGVMATTMRRVLVEHARARQAMRRGGGRHQVPLDGVEDVAHDDPCDASQLALLDALRQLESVSRRQAAVVSLRFFHGLDTGAVSRRLGVSVSTVERDWRAARDWLRSRLDDVPASS
jgi:RNA polymerase sigma factor (TIGR02999 family)